MKAEDQILNMYVESLTLCLEHSRHAINGNYYWYKDIVTLLLFQRNLKAKIRTICKILLGIDLLNRYEVSGLFYYAVTVRSFFVLMGK